MKKLSETDDHEGDADFEWALGLNRISLTIMGIWPLNKNGTYSKSGKEYTDWLVPFMIVVTFFGLFLPQLYALALVINDLPLVIENVITSCPAFVSCVKLFFIWRNEKVLRPMVHTVWRDWMCPRSYWELEIMKKEASRGRLITILDYSIMASCYSGFVVAPIIGFDLRTINNLTDYGRHHLLVQSYYPYDYSISPRFELALFFQLLGSFFVGLAMSVPDDYFGALVFHLSGQFHVLGTNIRDLVDIEDNGAVLNISVKQINGKFRACIARHVHLIKMKSAVEKTFSLVIGAQIFCMSTMVCCLGFQIICMLDNVGAKPTPLQIVTLTGTLLTMMIHTLVDCFASEVLTFYSGNIFYDIYSSKWYVLPQKQKRYILPMMILSLRPRQIKAGQIVHMSLATYCSIIKSTAGYISVLIAVRGR